MYALCNRLDVGCFALVMMCPVLKLKLWYVSLTANQNWSFIPSPCAWGGASVYIMHILYSFYQTKNPYLQVNYVYLVFLELFCTVWYIYMSSKLLFIYNVSNVCINWKMVIKDLCCFYYNFKMCSFSCVLITNTKVLGIRLLET